MFKSERRGDLLALVDEAGQAVAYSLDRAGIMRAAKTEYASAGVDVADCSGIHQIVCIDADCERMFLGFEAMKDHAEAVHTFSDIEELVRDAVRDKYNRDGDRNAVPPIPYRYAWCRDFATDWVVFEMNVGERGTLFKASYSITDGVVSLGAPVEVVRKTIYEPVKAETEAAKEVLG